MTDPIIDDPSYIRNIKDKYDKILAIEKNPYAAEFTDDPELQLAGLHVNVRVIEKLPKTIENCLAALMINPTVAYEYLSRENLVDMCIKVPQMLEYLPHDEERCKQVVSKNISALSYVKEMSPEIRLAAINSSRESKIFFR